MMKKHNGVEIRNKKLSGLCKILHQWIELIEDSSNRLSGKKDPLYWYNERATVSTFAGAIWQAGGLALEEYTTTKKHKKVKRYRKTEWKGGSDLWFRWKNADYVVEAKQCWPSLNKSTIQKRTIKAIKERLDEAGESVSNAPKEDYDCRLSLVFIVPEIPEKDKGKIDEILTTFLNGLRKTNFCLAVWVFPEAARELEWDKKIYPGVALIVRVHENQK